MRSSISARTARSNGCPARRWRSRPSAGRKRCSGALPVIYPFIVNNPGEAAQAKRRLAAVTIGHLTPPLSAGRPARPTAPSSKRLVDEYAAADGLDRRRAALLGEEIVDRAWTTGLAAECGLVRGDAGREAIARLDAQSVRHQGLCDPRRPARLRPRRAEPRREPRTGWRVSRLSRARSAAPSRRGNERARGAARGARRPARAAGAGRRADAAAAPTCCRPAATSHRRSARRADAHRRCDRRLAPPTRSFAAICRITAIIRARS